MFNEDRKNQYIAYHLREASLAPNVLERLFAQTAIFEEKFNKDICDFTSAEIRDFYMFLNEISFDHLNNKHSQLRAYTTWCINNGYTKSVINPFTEFDSAAIWRCINKTDLYQNIVTREYLVEQCKRLERYSDKFIFLGMFEGICGKQYCDIINARVGNINGNLYTTYSGKTFPITRQLIIWAESAAEETEYVFERRGRTIHAQLYGEADLIIKPSMMGKSMVGDGCYRVSFNSISRRLKDGLELLGLPATITSKDLLESGRIYDIKEDMKKLGIDAEHYFYSKGDEAEKMKLMCEYKYGFIQNKQMWLKQYGRYL